MERSAPYDVRADLLGLRNAAPEKQGLHSGLCRAVLHPGDDGFRRIALLKRQCQRRILDVITRPRRRPEEHRGDASSPPRSHLGSKG